MRAFHSKQKKGCAELKHILVRHPEAPAAPEYHQRDEWKLKVCTGFHLSLCLPSVLSFPPPYFFPRVKTALSHCHTDTYFYKFLFLFSVFLTFISLVVCCVFHFCYYLPFSLPLSVPTSLQPSMPHFLSLALLLCIFVILVCLTTGTQMALEDQQAQGGSSPALHIKAEVYPISPRVHASPPLCGPCLLLPSQQRCLSAGLHCPTQRRLFRLVENSGQFT